jgi:tetratricopeptide (TPR) repeat protein
MQRKYDEARPYLEKAIEEGPSLGQAYRDLGKLCLLTGQPEQALGYFKKVVQLAPDEASTHYLMAQAYRKLGNTAEVKVELEAFQKLRQEESERSTKHPNTSALGGVDAANERPQEDETLDDLK